MLVFQVALRINNGLNIAIQQWEMQLCWRMIGLFGSIWSIIRVPNDYIRTDKHIGMATTIIQCRLTTLATYRLASTMIFTSHFNIIIWFINCLRNGQSLQCHMDER